MHLAPETIFMKLYPKEITLNINYHYFKKINIVIYNTNQFETIK